MQARKYIHQAWAALVRWISKLQHKAFGCRLAVRWKCIKISWNVNPKNLSQWTKFLEGKQLTYFDNNIYFIWKFREKNIAWMKPFSLAFYQFELKYHMSRALKLNHRHHDKGEVILFNYTAHHWGIWGTGSITPRILNLVTRWSRVVTFTTRSL